jgi:hypothetical protein
MLNKERTIGEKILLQLINSIEYFFIVAFLLADVLIRYFSGSQSVTILYQLKQLVETMMLLGIIVTLGIGWVLFKQIKRLNHRIQVADQDGINLLYTGVLGSFIFFVVPLIILPALDFSIPTLFDGPASGELPIYVTYFFMISLLGLIILPVIRLVRLLDRSRTSSRSEIIYLIFLMAIDVVVNSFLFLSGGLLLGRMIKKCKWR